MFSAGSTCISVILLSGNKPQDTQTLHGLLNSSWRKMLAFWYFLSIHCLHLFIVNVRYIWKKCTLKVHVNRQLFKVKTIIKNSAAFEPVQVFFMDGLFWGQSPWYYYCGVTWCNVSYGVNSPELDLMECPR